MVVRSGVVHQKAPEHRAQSKTLRAGGSVSEGRVCSRGESVSEQIVGELPFAARRGSGLNCVLMTSGFLSRNGRWIAFAT
jgi:hypothetical protein